MTPSLAIGVPVRNESQNIQVFFESLMTSLRALPEILVWEVIFCLNGCTDDTQAILTKLIYAAPQRHRIKMIFSEEGKLVAQRKIADLRSGDGPLCFIDADVRLKSDTLALLWQKIDNDPSCFLAYARPEPIFPNQMNALLCLQKIHYRLRRKVYQRRHFHGRCFMMRQWEFPNPSCLSNISSTKVRRLKLYEGPMVDDILLSRHMVHRRGASALSEVQAAVVYFRPPSTLRALFQATRRAILEIRRLDLLYPEHADLEKMTFRQRWKFRVLRRYPFHIRALHGLHRLLEGLLRWTAKIDVTLVETGLVPLGVLWNPILCTKAMLC